MTDRTKLTPEELELAISHALKTHDLAEKERARLETCTDLDTLRQTLVELGLPEEDIQRSIATLDEALIIESAPRNRSLLFACVFGVLLLAGSIAAVYLMMPAPRKASLGKDMAKANLVEDTEGVERPSIQTGNTVRPSAPMENTVRPSVPMENTDGPTTLIALAYDFLQKESRKSWSGSDLLRGPFETALADTVRSAGGSALYKLTPTVRQEIFSKIDGALDLKAVQEKTDATHVITGTVKCVSQGQVFDTKMQSYRVFVDLQFVVLSASPESQVVSISQEAVGLAIEPTGGCKRAIEKALPKITAPLARELGAAAEEIPEKK